MTVVIHGVVPEAGSEVVEEAAGAFKVAALPGDLGDGIFFQEGLAALCHLYPLR